MYKPNKIGVWCGCWVRLLLLALLCSAQLGAQTPIHLVRMVDEAYRPQPDDEQRLAAFLEKHSRRLDTDNLGPTVRQGILGQSEIFDELASFEEAGGGSVRVEFITWGDAFRFFSDYTTDRSNPPLVAQMGDTWVPFFRSLNTIAYAERQTWDLRLLWYWRDLVDAERIQTGAGFQEVCGELKNSDSENLIAPFVIPTAANWNLLHDLAIWIYNAGAEELISTRPKFGFIPWKEATLAGPAGEKAAQFLIELASRKWVDLPDRQAGDVAEDFLDKKYAMAILGSWVASRARDRFGPGWWENIAYTLPPVIGAEHSRTFKGGSFLVVVDPSRGSRAAAVEPAIRLVRHLSAPESLERYLPALDDLPANQGVLTQAHEGSSFIEVLEYGKSYPEIPEWAPLVENLSTRDNLYAFWKRLSALATSDSPESRERRSERERLVLAALRTAESEINAGLSPGIVSRLQPLLIGLALLLSPLALISYWNRVKTRRLAEQQIRESELRYRDLYENAPDMFCSVSNPSGRITHANRMVAEKTGYTLEEIIGKPIDELYHPDCWPRLQEAREEFLKSGRVRDVELQLRRKDGSCLEVSTNVSAIRDASGSISGRRLIWRDISFRKQAQRQLQLQREELAHVSRVATVGELAASLAHELNQPLAAIVANSQAGRRLLNKDPLDVKELVETLNDISADGRRAGEIIRHVRGFLRKGSVENEPVDLNELVRGIESLLHGDTAIRGVSLSLDLDPDIPLVFGDPIQLQQVVLNLVLNASEAMSGQSEDRTIVVRTMVTEQGAAVAVTDNGPGIPESHVVEMFQPFFTTKDHGLGLGLSISRSIIEEHGGQLTAHPESPRGLTLKLTLPGLKTTDRLPSKTEA